MRSSRANACVVFVADTCVQLEHVAVKPPLTVDFQVPMFTSSGLQVRSLKVYERSNYPTVKWVRYVTRSGSYAIRLA